MVTRPWRGPAPGRPAVPLPPERMPLLRGGRPLKAWTYVGAFGADVMLCAAVARIGGLRVAWWAVWDGTRLAEGRRGVAVSAERVAARGRIAVALERAGEPVEVVSPHGRQYAWTRKTPVTVRGHVLGRAVELRGILDESAGYHARHTAWRWSAGVGELESGEPVTWNLVAGIHDAPEASERTLWIAGEPHELPPVEFADDLSAVGDLRFTRLATRARRENRLLVRSDYEQPFGTFEPSSRGLTSFRTSRGQSPLGLVVGTLRAGLGVIERHEVRW